MEHIIMNYHIRELRNKTGLTQKRFSEEYGIPLSTLRKWEQGESSPPEYVVALLARSVPGTDQNLRKIKGRNGSIYYYNEAAKTVFDSAGNGIAVSEDLNTVKETNLSLYLSDLFSDFYEIRERFNRDCRFDREQDIIWV